MEDNIKILVCCHKHDIYVDKAPYFPIHVGKALHSSLELGIQPDNIGDNISEKNASYCELTGMYWAWKNLNDVAVIGLCHYRRYFDFSTSLSPLTSIVKTVNDIELSNFSVPDKILNKVRKGYVVVPRKFVFSTSVYTQYCECHNGADFLKMGEILKKEYPPKYYRSYVKLMYNENKLSPCNMFLMRWDIFDQYCSWLFPLLLKIEQVTDISSYDVYQKRLYGYLAERLFNIYIDANELSVIERPVLFIGEKGNKGLLFMIKGIIKKQLNNIVFALMKMAKANRNI